MNNPTRTAVDQYTQLPDEEKAAIKQALDIGEEYGYGNIMAWLATEWACHLRDNAHLPAYVAIAAVSNRSPYPLPRPAPTERPAP